MKCKSDDSCGKKPCQLQIGTGQPTYLARKKYQGVHIYEFYLQKKVSPWTFFASFQSRVLQQKIKNSSGFKKSRLGKNKNN
jgi:hypothetical protein